MNKKILHKTLNRAVSSLILLGLTVTFTSQANAGMSLETLGTTEKVIRVQGVKEGLSVSLKANKNSFKVGETIRFTVKGNKTFFLYLFSIDKKANQGVLILPNKLDKMNKYPAKRALIVPNAKVEFVADKVGTERLIIIASTKYLDLKTKGYKKAGDFLVSDAATVDNQVKAIRIQAAPEKINKTKNEVIVKEISIKITGKKRAATKSSKSPLVFVSTDRREYKEGDAVRMVFGADAKGYIHLYLKQPKGKTVLLKKVKVNGKSMYHQKAIAKAPLGKHELIIRYTKNGKDSLKNKSKAKGISIVIEDKPEDVQVTPQMNYQFVTKKQ